MTVNLDSTQFTSKFAQVNNLFSVGKAFELLELVLAMNCLDVIINDLFDLIDSSFSEIINY